jgi:hypothetical protein
MKIGKANYENRGSSKKHFKIVDNDNVYRILPPMGSLADDGRWSKYYSIVWGYKNAEGKSVPFADCRKTNYRTKMVEIESAAYVRSEKIKAQYADLLKKERDGEPVDAKMLEKLQELSEQFNIDNKHYVNAVNLQGEIGVLKLGAKAKALLEEEIKLLMAKGVDPLSVENGRYFNIRRTGRGFQTQYQVTVYKEQRMVDGELAEFPKVHKMDDAFLARLETEAADLGKLYIQASQEQVERIVKGENPDTVLGINRNRNASAPIANDMDNGEEDLETYEAKIATPAASIEKPKLDTSALTAALAKPDVAPKAAAPAPAAASAALSDEEFLKQMGL